MTPQSSEWPPSVPSLGRLIEIGDRRDLKWFLRRYIIWILGCGAAFLFGAIVYNYFYPPLYVSRAKVRFMPPQVAGRFVNPNFSMQAEQRLFALSQLLSSRLTATKLIESQGLYPERRRFDTVADLTPSFQENLKITQIRGANPEKSPEVPTLHLEFGYPQPEKAQKVLQKLIEQVYEENRKYRGDQSLGTTEFLDEQLASAEEAMLEAEQRLGDIQESIGTSEARSKMGETTGRMYVVDSRLRDLRHDQRGLDERRVTKKAEFDQSELQHKRLELKPLDAYLTEVERVESHWHQRDRVLIARGQVGALRARWAPGYPDLIQAETELAEMERVLAEMGRNLARGMKNRDLELSAGQLAKARLDLAALEAQTQANLQEERDLRAEAQRLREQLNIPVGQETELLGAKREYESCRERYKELLKKQQESKAASDLERRGQGETVELLEPASLPTEASPPKLWVRFAGALSAGLFLGMLLGLAHLLASPLLLHGGHLEAWAGIPVLASFEPPSRRSSGRWSRGALAGATLLSILFSSGCADLLTGAAGYYARGKAEERKGRLAGAMLYYRQAMQKDARYADAYEAAAMIALRLGELEPAREFLARAVEFHPDSHALHKTLAEVSYQIYFADPGRPTALLREVEAEADLLRKKWPQLPDGHRIAAQVLMERHRLEESVQLLEDASRKVARNESLRAQWAAALFRLNRPGEAEVVLRQLIAERSGYSDAYDILYLQFMQKQRAQEAREVLEKKWKCTGLLEAALQLAAHDDAAGNRAEVYPFLEQVAAAALGQRLGMAAIGDFWLNRGEWAAARAAYEMGMTREQGQRSEYIGRMAEWNLLQGRRGDAAALVEAEKKRYPDSSLLEAYSAALQLGEASDGRRAEERRRLESILAKMPESPFVRYHLGRAYLLENKISAAAEQFEKSIKLDANYTAGWLALAELELARGNPGLAESRADSVLRSHRGNAAAFMVRAKAQAVRGRMKEAQESYRSVLSLEPANRDAQYGLAAAVAAQGRLAEAEKLFAAGKEAEPSDPRWILAQSTALSNAGKIVEARRLLEQAGKSAPSAEKLYERLAEVQLSMRDGESARATFQRLVEAQPKNLNYQLGLAGSFALAGKPERAIEVYKGLQVSNGDDVRVWLEPAVLLDELGREEAAISNYREALKRQKDHPIALNNLAWRLLKQGKDLQLALEYAQQAKRALPRVPEVDGTLAEAYTRLAMYRNAAAVYEEMLAYIDAKNKPRILKLLEETRRMSTGKARNA